MNTKGVDIALYDSKKKEVSKEDDEKVILINKIVIIMISLMENLLKLIKESLMI